MYGYIYFTENIINGMCYIGQHKADKFDTKYKGSGHDLKKAFKKYGKENFITTVVEWCNTKDELDNREIYWIAKCNAVESPYFYNLVRGGYGCSGYKHTEDTKIRISCTEKGLVRGPQSELHRKHESEAAKHRPPISDETRERRRLSMIGKNKGKKATEETKRKLSESHKGKHPWNYGMKTKLVNGKRLYYREDKED